MFQDAALEEPDGPTSFCAGEKKFTLMLADSPRSPQEQMWTDQSWHSALIQQLVQVGETLSGGSVDKMFRHKWDFN